MLLIQADDRVAQPLVALVVNVALHSSRPSVPPGPRILPIPEPATPLSRRFLTYFRVTTYLSLVK
jgi:hypothetical protein